MSLTDVWNNVTGALSHTTPIGLAVNAGQDVAQTTATTQHVVQHPLSIFGDVTAPNKGSGKTPPGFGTWLVAMAALAGVLLLMSDSDKWQPVGTALAAVIAVTVAFKWGKPAMYEVDAVFGTTFISKKA